MKRMLAITDRRCEKPVLAITDRRTETGADDSCCKAGKVPSRIAASIQQQNQLALGLCFPFPPLPMICLLHSVASLGKS